MVGMSAPAGMPSRRYSAVILGGSWPHTDPQSCQSCSEAQHAEGIKNLDLADVVRGASNRVAAELSGQVADGFVEASGRIAAMYVSHADRWFAMARVSEEVGRLGYGLREDLDQIDLKAHQEIARLEERAQLGAGLLALSQIGQVVAKARAEAMAKSATATAAVEKLAPQLTAGSGQAPNPAGGQQGAGGDPVDPKLREMRETGGGPSGGHGIGNMPAGWDKFPQSPPPPGRPQAGSGGQQGPGSPPPGGQPGSQGQNTPGNATGAGNNPGSGKAPHPQAGQEQGLSTDGIPAPPLPFSGGSGGGLPSPTGGGGMPGGGGFKLPETPGGLSSLGGGGGLPQGLTPTNFSPAAGGMAPSTGAPTDFSRGFGAGLGAGPAPLAPPVTSPSSMSTSAAPAGAYSPGPAAVAASGGAPAVSSPVPPAVATPAPSSGGGVPAGPVGPLPPFGSDVPRTAVAPSSGAPVSAASGAPLAPSVPGGGAPGSASVAPLPPGVAGSGVGASAGAAAEGVRSSRPDPLLESASQLVYQLLHASQKSKYLFMDWCVGVFRTQSGVETVIVNSDGAGYIPAGVFVPRSSRMLFADSSLSPAFRAQWFSWANPAETMLAYAELVTKNNPGVELWALAVSTSYGGSSVPARAAGVPHCADCPVELSPISETASPMPLDESHMHRLETVDRALYARLLGFGDGPLPDPSEAWRMTQKAAEAALGRAGAVRDLAVSPVIREILGTLRSGVPVKQERWMALEGAYFEAVGMGTSLRPGLISRDGASPHVLAYFDLSRLIEILLLWGLDNETDGRGIKYPEIAYLARQIVDDAHGEGG